MRCFYHQDVEAVACCKHCGRGFAWMLIPAGLIFLLASLLHYTTGRRFQRE